MRPSSSVLRLLFAGALAAFVRVDVTPAASREASCSQPALAAAKVSFQQLAILNRFRPGSVSPQQLEATSLAYIEAASACVPVAGEDSGLPVGPQHDDVLTFGSSSGLASDSYTLFGTKWGAGSPFGAGGQDNDGPRLPGGTVTYSYMGDGIDLTGDIGATGMNLAITSLPTYQPCFLAEIANAFAAWSAVADIQFVEVADNGLPFNADGAAGDIRIGAHAMFDRGHAYLPPPQGRSAAGDIHFNSTVQWSCTSDAGTLDIGVVALHEIGHAIGLLHDENGVMRSGYRPLASMPLGDDIDGAVSLYGSATGASDDLLLNFGPDHGVWVLDYGVSGESWRQVHTRSPELTAVGNWDNNGLQDVVFDFGPGHGLWLYRDGRSWTQVDPRSPETLALLRVTYGGVIVGFFDQSEIGTASGLYGWGSDKWSPMTSLKPRAAFGVLNDPTSRSWVFSFEGGGIWTRGPYVSTFGWLYLHNLDASVSSVGHFNEASGHHDLLLGFPGLGLYQLIDGTTWMLVHSEAPVRAAVGDLDVRDLRDDLVLDFGAAGLWTLTNGTVWSQLHSFPSEALAVGDLDNNAQGDIVVDFGDPWGLWVLFNSSAWIQLHALSPVDIHVVDFN